MSPGLSGKTLRIMAVIFSSLSVPVPKTLTLIETGSATPMA